MKGQSISKKQLLKCFRHIESLFVKEYLDQFRETPESDLEQYQYQLGTMIRLHILTERSSLYRTFLWLGYHDRDEMSMFLIQSYYAWARKNKERAGDLE